MMTKREASRLILLVAAGLRGEFPENVDAATVGLGGIRNEEEGLAACAGVLERVAEEMSGMLPRDLTS